MTLYLVKYGSNDWRLHREDGTEIDTYTDDPNEQPDGPIPEIIDSIADFHGTVTLLTDAQARRDHTNALSGNWVFRDVEEHGPTEIPF